MNIRYRRDIWTFLLITAVTVLIWYWAAGETRAERSLPVRLQFTVAESEGWLIEPASHTVTISAEGSQRAIRNAPQSVQRLEVMVTPASGVMTIDVAEALRAHPAIRETGISILSVDPAEIELNLDRIVTVTGQVVANLPQGVEVETVAPDQVRLTMPERNRQLLPREIEVDAIVGRDQLSALQPGMSHTLENVRLRLPERYRSREAVVIDPPAAKVTLTIRSQIEQFTLDLVRINLAGPPEDHEYIVEFEPNQLRNVTISAPSDLIAQIRAGEATVFAFLHLKSTEKDSRPAAKPVTCFVALLPDGRAEPVEFKSTEDSTAWPIIALKITDRPEG